MFRNIIDSDTIINNNNISHLFKNRKPIFYHKYIINIMSIVRKGRIDPIEILREYTIQKKAIILK